MQRYMKGLLAGLLFITVVACSDQSLEPNGGQGLGAVDSTAWREQMARRPGPLFAGGMTECGAGACSFTPADFICGANKANCNAQTSAIDVAWIVTNGRKTVNVSGRGALLCNSTMGTVVAYDAVGDVVATQDMVPISPADCGSDNITFGGQATVSSDGGIDHIVITPMSPFTFPVQGGGTGIADETYTVTYNDDAVPYTVACSPTVTRAATVTCTATPTGAGGTGTIVAWQFVSDLDGHQVNRDPGTVSSTTWSGQLVVPGHVEVTASVNGVVFGQPLLSNTIAITPRDWSAVAVPKTFGQLVPSQLPLHPTTIEAQLGQTSLRLPTATPLPFGGPIADGGPNVGYEYLTGPPFAPDDSVRISEALEVNSDFYLQQQVSDKRVHGILMCGRSRVAQLKSLIEAHEGLNWPTQPNSHSAIFFRVADSLTRVEGERAVGFDDIPISTLSSSIFSRASSASAAMDGNAALNNIHMTLPDSLVSVGGIQCKFKFF